MSLMVCNGKNWRPTIDVSELHDVMTDPQGPRHMPINHGHILEMFKEKIAADGIVIGEEQGLLSKDLFRYFFVAEVSDSMLPDLNFNLGFINFNDRSCSFTGLAGERVFACSNMQFSGKTIDIRRRHTTNVLSELSDKIDAIIARFKQFQRTRSEEIGSLKDCGFDDDNVAHCVLEMHRKTWMSNSDIGRVVAEWDAPTFSEFEDRTAWSFNQAVTHILKKTDNPVRLVQINNQVQDIIFREVSTIAG